MSKKVVIITGASSGIGEALAYEYQKKNDIIVLAARNFEKISKIVTSYINQGGQALAIQADVSKKEDCERIISKTIETFGRIDILINNAGISMRAIFEEVDTEVIHQVMNTNFWGTVYCTKYALPYLLNSHGSVIGISSIAGYQGLPGRTAYSASKFAIHGFLETLRVENMKTGLHVMIACPGFTATNIRFSALDKDGKKQGESPRKENNMMSPEKVAKKIVHAIGKKRRTLILTLEGKLVVFFRKMIPSFMDKRAYISMLKEPNSPLK